MRFFSSPLRPAAHAKPPLPMLVALPDMPEDVAADTEACGWFDSSFDLSTGLLVSEQDSDGLYWLWALN